MAQADSTGSSTSVVIVDTDILSMFAKADALVWLGRLFGQDRLTATGQNVSAGDVRATIGVVAPEGYGVLDARARSRRGVQRKDKQRVKGDSLRFSASWRQGW